MKKPSKLFDAALLGVALSIGSSAARGEGVNTQTLNLSTSGDYQILESGGLYSGYFSTPSNEAMLIGRATYHFAENPMVEYSRSSGTRLGTVVDGIHTLALSASLQRPNWIGFIETQVHLVNLVSVGTYRPVLGDTRLAAKFPVTEFEEDKMRLAVLPELWIPTGSTRYLVSNGGGGIGVKGALERDFGGFRGAINLGLRAFTHGVYRDIDYRLQLPWAIGSVIPLDADSAINAELTQALNAFPSSGQNPGELYVGYRRRFQLGSEGNSAIGTAGASVGQFDFDAANPYRLQIGIQFGLK